MCRYERKAGEEATRPTSAKVPCASQRPSGRGDIFNSRDGSAGARTNSSAQTAPRTAHDRHVGLSLCQNSGSPKQHAHPLSTRHAASQTHHPSAPTPRRASRCLPRTANWPVERAKTPQRHSQTPHERDHHPQARRHKPPRGGQVRAGGDGEACPRTTTPDPTLVDDSPWSTSPAVGVGREEEDSAQERGQPACWRSHYRLCQ